jgi:hypothetical protein
LEEYQVDDLSWLQKNPFRDGLLSARPHNARAIDAPPI